MRERESQRKLRELKELERNLWVTELSELRELERNLWLREFVGYSYFLFYFFTLKYLVIFF